MENDGFTKYKFSFELHLENKGFNGDNELGALILAADELGAELGCFQSEYQRQLTCCVAPVRSEDE